MRAEVTYLITGGLGGLGLQVARQIVQEGARHLLLVSRRGIVAESQRLLLAELAEAGAEVQVVQADIAEEESLRALLARCSEDLPLAGIFHCAGVLDDGMVTMQTAERLRAVLRPKVVGGWHLHCLTATRQLDYFVAFSSAASLLGSPGQSSYAAANGFLDGLMQARRSQGLVGLSIQWGPWSEVGMAAAVKGQRWDMGRISPDQGRLLLSHLSNWRHSPAQVGVLPFEQPPKTLQEEAVRRSLSALLAPVSASERYAELVRLLRQDVAEILGFASPEAISIQQPLFESGIDSLMATQLRNRLAESMERPLSATLVFELPTIAQLARWILDQLYPGSEEPVVLPASLSDTQKTVRKIEQLAQLSEEDAEALLLQKLMGL
jgi:myxalamid-type polyketide synthase MxaB